MVRKILSNTLLTILIVLPISTAVLIVYVFVYSFLTPAHIEKINCDLNSDEFSVFYFGEELRFQSKYISSCETTENSSGLEPPLSIIKLELKLPDLKPVEQNNRVKQDVLFLTLTGFKKKYSQEIENDNELLLRCGGNNLSDDQCCSNSRYILDNLFYKYCFENKYLESMPILDLEISNFIQKLRVKK